MMQGEKDQQEDFLWPYPETVAQGQHVFIMCDGVGGQDCGEVASQTAATALGNYLAQNTSPDDFVTKDMFEEALAYAYDELDKADTGSAKKMGTTMTCLVLHRGGALVAHIGDSRIYQLRPSQSCYQNAAPWAGSGIIYQSADHSLVNELLRLGEITEEEAEHFPQKNVITRAMQPNLERRHKADIYNLTDIQPGDYFFLCCDGVLERLTNDKLGAILADTSLDDLDKLNAILDVCKGRTHDNYTCWLIPIRDVVREACDAEQESEDTVVVTTVVEDIAPAIAPMSCPQEDYMESQAQHTNYNYSQHTDNKQHNTKRYLYMFAGVCVFALAIWSITDFLLSNDKPETVQQEVEAVPAQAAPTPRTRPDINRGGVQQSTQEAQGGIVINLPDKDAKKEENQTEPGNQATTQQQAQPSQTPTPPKPQTEHQENKAQTEQSATQPEPERKQETPNSQSGQKEESTFHTTST